MKFDYIVGNPPYLKGMHITIFNKMLIKTRKHGEVKFIHPMGGVLIKNTNKERDKFKEALDEYKSSVVFIKNPFPIYLGGFLGITSVKKIPGDLSWDYFGRKYIGDVKDINTLLLPPGAYRRISDAYWKYIKEHKAVSSKITEEHGACISLIAANPKFSVQTNLNSKVFTVSKMKDSPYSKQKKILCQPSEIKNVYQYLNSIPARMGLMLTKHDQNITTKSIPLVPFDLPTEEYSTEKLFDRFKISKEDQKLIIQVFNEMPDDRLLIDL